MKTGDILPAKFPRKDGLGNHCPFCNETTVDHKQGTYTCGYCGRWENDYVAHVGGVCSNHNKPQPEPPIFTGFDLLK